MTKLKERKCKPCNGEVPPMAKEEAIEMLKQIDGWDLSEDGKMIEYEFEKDKFYFFTPGCDQNCDIIKKIMFEEAQIKMKSNITNDMMNIKTESKYAAIS